MRLKRGLTAVAGGIAAVSVVAAPVVAQTTYGGESATAPLLKFLTERLEATAAQEPALLGHLANLSAIFDGRSAALLVGVIVAGLVAEYVARQLLLRVRVRIFQRHAHESPLRAFLHAILLDLLALLALWIAARFVVGQIGDPEAVPARVGRQFLQALLYWRGFNLVFRAWLRPNTPEGRIAPIDDATAKRLLLGLNVVIVLPMLAHNIVTFLLTTGAGSEATSTAVVFYSPLIAAALLLTVWHWRHDMAAWLGAMVGERDTWRPMKLGIAHGWWVGGLIFYGLAGASAFYAALTDKATAVRGLAVLESTLIGLLLFETLLFRLTRHLPSELPTVGDVVAGCVRLAVRLIAVVGAAEAVIVHILGLATPAEWAPQSNAVKIAAIAAFTAYTLWRFLKYRMDFYILQHPLPTAGVVGEVDEEAPTAASRLSTLMPVLRVTAGVTIFVIGTLLVLSELGVNITPLIAGASVLGLAVSFGSQSLVRDIVSGMFFLAEDSFRVGEYLDSGRVKGTVEGFTIRSIRLRHQNGQLHIVPFGQLGHITNFSRDWTTVKFNLAFKNDTDVELLRKTVKKIGLDMMTEPAYQKELLQPLKMQGIVDIKDASLVIRFKFTAKPKNPSLIQRTAIRRMYEAFPSKGIHFALPPIMFPNLAPPPAPQQT